MHEKFSIQVSISDDWVPDSHDILLTSTSVNQLLTFKWSVSRVGEGLLEARTIPISPLSSDISDPVTTAVIISPCLAPGHLRWVGQLDGECKAHILVLSSPHFNIKQ